jgi:hypothetical protein
MRALIPLVRILQLPSPFDCTYPGGPLVTCGALQILQNFLDIFSAFVQIFTTPLLIPNKRDAFFMDGNMMAKFSAPARRESIQTFKKRYDGVIQGLSTPGANYAEVVTAAVYGYDMSDCYTDPLTCHCRNLDIPDICIVDSAGQVTFGPLGTRKRKRDDGTTTVEPMTADDIPAVMSTHVFTGETICDHVVGDHANTTWDAIKPDRKNQYMKCLDKMVQGTRLNHISNVFPVDFMYNTQGPMTLVHNMFHKVRESVRTKHEHAQRRKRSARDELERRFPKFDEQLRNRTRFAQEVLETQYQITPQKSMVFDAAIKADRIWFKYTTGYYNFLVENMVEGISEGQSILPSTSEAIADVRYALWDLKNIVMSQPYGKVFEASVNATKLVSRHVGLIMDEGVGEFITRTYNQYAGSRKRNFDATHARKAAEFEQSIQASPLYRWIYAKPYNTTRNGVLGGGGDEPVTFRQHLVNVVGFQREHWRTESLNFFNADLKFWSFAEIFKSRFSKPEWQPHHLANWEKLKRAYYQTYNRIWPGHLTHEQKERFLFNSNCVLADRAVNITIKVVDYCANEYIPNLNLSKKRKEALGAVGKYFDDISRYREDTYYGYKNRPRFTEEHSVPGDTTSWIRPRLILPNVTQPDSHKVDYRVYRRGSLALTQHGPAGFNLFYWLVRVIEDITGWAIGAQTDTWYAAIKAWIINPNTDIKDYPDVGLAYAIRFEFVCNFPESLNCSIGAGLETALLWVTVGFVVLFIVAGYALPILLVPFTFVGLGLSYWIVLSAVAWHFPMACLVMSPSFPLPFGVGLPSCLMDQLLAFLDKWVTSCYSPLVIPSYMIAGDVCPSDPTVAIDVLNCADVGVSDGIQNILYLGVWVLGQGFCDFAMQVSATVLRPFVPGVQTYMETTLNSFKTASATDKKRMTFCFYATIPTILFPGVVLLLIGIVGAIMIPQILVLVNGLVTLFFATPAAAAVPGLGGPAAETWFDDDTESEGFKDEPETTSISQRIRDSIWGPVQKEKME